MTAATPTVEPEISGPVDPIQKRLDALRDETGGLYHRVLRKTPQGGDYVGQVDDAEVVDGIEEWIRNEFGGGEYQCRVFVRGQRGQKYQYAVRVAGAPKASDTRPAPMPTPQPVPLGQPMGGMGGTDWMGFIVSQNNMMMETMRQQASRAEDSQMRLLEMLLNKQEATTPIQDVKTWVEFARGLSPDGPNDGEIEFIKALAPMFPDIVEKMTSKKKPKPAPVPVRPDVIEPHAMPLPPANEPPEEMKAVNNELAMLSHLVGLLEATAEMEDRDPVWYAEGIAEVMGDDGVVAICDLHERGQVADAFIASHPQLEAQRPFVLSIEDSLRNISKEVQQDDHRPDETARVDETEGTVAEVDDTDRPERKEDVPSSEG